MKWLAAWLALALAIAALPAARAWLAERRRRGPDFRDTEEFVLGADAWCHAHPDALAHRPVQTPAPTPGLTPARQRVIESEARAAARHDYADNRRRRANPYRLHTREGALWAITYGEAWTGYELAAFGTADPVQ